MTQSSPNGLKTLQENEKMLITSNFSFSHSVFKKLVLQTRKNKGLFWKGLTPCNESEDLFPLFLCLQIYRKHAQITIIGNDCSSSNLLDSGPKNECSQSLNWSQVNY